MKAIDMAHRGSAVLIKATASKVIMQVDKVGECVHVGRYAVVTKYLMAKGLDLGIIEAWEQRVGSAVVLRFNNWIMRDRIINNALLGSLKVTRDGEGALLVYRQHLGKCSTSMVKAPLAWSKRFYHVQAGKVYNGAGDFLYKLT